MVCDSGAVATEPLAGRVPLQPPPALHAWAPTALHFRVTVWPELTLVALDSSEIEGWVTVAAAAEPAALELMESPWQAASPVRATHAAPQPSSRVPNRGANPRRWRRRTEVIKYLPVLTKLADFWVRATCHNDDPVVITLRVEILGGFASAAKLSLRANGADWRHERAGEMSFVA